MNTIINKNILYLLDFVYTYIMTIKSILRFYYLVSLIICSLYIIITLKIYLK